MLKIPSTIEKFESRADGTWKLIIGTQELAQEDVAELAMQKGSIGQFVFSAQEQIKEEDIPTEKIEFKNDKTPSQRLRAIFYKQWEQLNPVAGKKKVDWEMFYKVKMERLIESEKEKLR